MVLVIMRRVCGFLVLLVVIDKRLISFLVIISFWLVFVSFRDDNGMKLILEYRLLIEW